MTLNMEIMTRVYVALIDGIHNMTIEKQAKDRHSSNGVLFHAREA